MEVGQPSLAKHSSGVQSQVATQAAPTGEDLQLRGQTPRDTGGGSGQQTAQQNIQTAFPHKVVLCQLHPGLLDVVLWCAAVS